MVAARNLDVTHHVDRVIREVHGNIKVTRKLSEDIDDNILATKTLTEDVGQKVNVIEWVAHNVDNNVKASKRCTHVFLSLVFRVPAHFSYNLSAKQQRMTLEVCYPLIVPSLTDKADPSSQEASCEKNFEHGSLLQTLPSITMLHAQRSMEGLQSGLFKEAYFGNGEKIALQVCYGYKAVVRLSRPLRLYYH